MHKMNVRFYQSILYILVLFIFGLAIGCSKLSGGLAVDNRIIEGQVLHESTHKPLENTEIFLYRQTRPLFSMRGWEQIAETKTDESGRFIFEVSARGPFEIRWNLESFFTSQWFYIEDFEGSKNVQIFYVEREVQVYPLDEGPEHPQN